MKRHLRLGKLKKYLPEILTITAVIGIPVGDVLLYRAIKKEESDGKKSHYILPIIVHSTSIAAIIASNRVSNAQKLSLIAAGAASTTRLTTYQRQVKEEVSPEVYQKINKRYDDIELEEILDACVKGDFSDSDSSVQTFIFPQLYKAFQMRFDDLMESLVEFDENYRDNSFATINDLLEKLGDPVPDGDAFGWWICYDDPDWSPEHLSPSFEDRIVKGHPVVIVRFFSNPMKEAEWKEYYDALMREEEIHSNELKSFSIKKDEVPFDEH